MLVLNSVRFLTPLLSSILQGWFGPFDSTHCHYLAAALRNSRLRDM